ncbi:MAG TPA: 4-hydroxy-4-methyl-2-oxoglutarate aldolase [Burkholderiales bacterium]|nr:4-hydroxy-4-methyl-2-oxoglutarate aldolase [Burkholderiales bacterium]
MIGEPIALTIRRTISRPAAAVLDKFQGAPTGFVTDAFNGKGCLDYAIKPLTAEMYLCGPAVTAFCPPGDILAVMATLDVAKKGDVIVIAGGGETSAAKLGDLWLHWAGKIGVVGVVVDGLVRDVNGLLSTGVPVFSRGACPNGGFKNGPGEVNMPVSCGGIAINPGDIIVGDRDGVVAVPLTRAEEVVSQLELVRQKEAEAERKVKSGQKLEFWKEAALQARNAVRYID